MSALNSAQLSGLHPQRLHWETRLYFCAVLAHSEYNVQIYIVSHDFLLIES